MVLPIECSHWDSPNHVPLTPCLRTHPLETGAAFTLEEFPLMVILPLSSHTPVARAEVSVPSNSSCCPCDQAGKTPGYLVVWTLSWAQGCLLPVVETLVCTVRHGMFPLYSSLSSLSTVLDCVSTAETQVVREAKRWFSYCWSQAVTWSTVHSPFTNISATELAHNSGTLHTNFHHVDCVLWTSSGSTGDSCNSNLYRLPPAQLIVSGTRYLPWHPTCLWSLLDHPWETFPSHLAWVASRDSEFLFSSQTPCQCPHPRDPRGLASIPWAMISPHWSSQVTRGSPDWWLKS